MKKRKRTKLCALFLVMVMTLSVFPTTAFASEKTFDLKGQIGNGQSRDMVLPGTTSSYNGQTWKNATLTFESSDASATETNPLKLIPVLEKDDVFAAGTSYTSSKGISGTLAKDTDKDGIYEGLSLTAKKNGPAKETKTFYMTVTHVDGKVDYYKLSVVRKGYVGIEWNTFMCYTDPGKAYVLSSYDSETKRMYAGTNFVNQSALTGLYDEDGDNILKTYDVQFQPQDKDKDVLTVENNNYYAKVPGIYQVDYYYDKMDQTFSQYVVARYAKNIAKEILGEVETDGVNKVDQYEDEKMFAELFPTDYQETAEQFFKNCKDLETKLEGNWESLAQYEDSLKLYQLSQNAPEVWANVYGRKEAKEEITNRVSNYPERAQEALTKIAEKYCGLIDLGYSRGTITSESDVQEYVQDAIEEMKEATTISLKDCKAELSETEYVYDGKEKTPSVTVTDQDGNVVSDDKYTVIYRSNVNAGTAYAVVKAEDEGYRGTQVLDFTIQKAEQKITVPVTEYTLTEGEGSTQIHAEIDSKNSVGYRSSNESVAIATSAGKIFPMGAGTAEITISADENSNYRAAESVKVKVTVKAKEITKVVPIPEKLASVKKLALKSKKAKQLLISWKRDRKVSGYEIIVAANPKFTAKVKKKIVKKNTVTSLKIKGLKGNKKYYVKVRSFKYSSGGKIYSKWSKVKAVKIKK